jgi:uncharacterized membrane protein YoaK (UPF0700 family)
MDHVKMEGAHANLYVMNGAVRPMSPSLTKGMYQAGAKTVPIWGNMVSPIMRYVCQAQMATMVVSWGGYNDILDERLVEFSLLKDMR